MPQINEIVYSDLPLNLTSHPVTGNIKMLSNADAVKQSVKNLVLTNFFERPYDAFKGGDILAQLFENMDPLTEYNLTKNVEQVLKNHEPRATVDDIKTRVIEDQNAINMEIIFQVINIPEQLTVTVLLERVR